MQQTKSAMAILLLFAGLLISATATAQTPARFDFTFEDSGSGATATGFIVFDLDLLPNPGRTGFFPLPDPLVLDLEVAVSGASVGNGLFAIEDFSAITWDTGELALNLSPGVQVVGQPAIGGVWGDTACSDLDLAGDGPGFPCGDFNLFSPQSQPTQILGYSDERGLSTGPNGVAPFILAASGGAGESMTLVSFMRSGPAAPTFSVPTLSAWSIALFSLLLLVAGGLAVRLRA